MGKLTASVSKAVRSAQSWVVCCYVPRHQLSFLLALLSFIIRFVKSEHFFSWPIVLVDSSSGWNAAVSTTGFVIAVFLRLTHCCFYNLTYWSWSSPFGSYTEIMVAFLLIDSYCSFGWWCALCFQWFDRFLICYRMQTWVTKRISHPHPLSVWPAIGNK